MKEKFRKFSSFAIIGILMFSGCLGIGTEEAIGTNSNPQAVVEVTGSRVVDLGTSIQFDASKSFDDDGSVVSYYWDFGDGNNDNKETVIHKYSAPGEYIVALSVTDDKGAVGTNDFGLTYITVLAGALDEDSGLPYAIISTKASVIRAGTEIELNGAGSWSYVDGSPSTDDIESWEWDFGDGKTATGRTVNHTFGSSGGLSSYSTSGSYIVKLKVTNSAGLQDIVFRTIRVLSAESSSVSSPDPTVYTSVSIGDPKTLDPAEAYDSAVVLFFQTLMKH